MWDCGINYPFGFGNWFMGGGIFGFSVKILIISALIFIVYKLVKPGNATLQENTDRKDSLEIIKERFARGEISEQEYNRMKDILN